VTIPGQTLPPPFKRILLVDDEAAVRELTAHGLKRKGFEVTTAADGRRAMALLQEQTFDLVITDICMPEADGFELLNFLRALAHRPPVIAMSGGGDYLGAAQNLKVALGLGAGAPLVKPFTLQRLLDTIAEVAKARADRI
jgi:DNA-binding NtrC family response regulator